MIEGRHRDRLCFRIAHFYSCGGSVNPGTSIFGRARRIASQFGRFERSIMTTENSGPLFSCSRTYSPRILQNMSKPVARALQFEVMRLSICSRRSLPLPTGSVKNLVSSAFMSGCKCWFTASVAYVSTPSSS